MVGQLWGANAIAPSLPGWAQIRNVHHPRGILPNSILLAFPRCLSYIEVYITHVLYFLVRAF